MVKPAGVWVVAACFNEQAVITHFIERVLAVPGVERLVLIDDGSRDGTVDQIRAFQKHQQELVYLEQRVFLQQIQQLRRMLLGM